jgi:hypothetical protein
MPDRYFAPAWTTLPIAARRCRVRNPFNGVVAELDANRHAVLTACTGCRSLDEHLAGVRASLGVRDEDAAAIRGWLREFAAQRLLVGEDELVRALGAAHAEPPAAIAGIAVRTCDRPALLERALASAAALSSRSGRRGRYLVLDDSRDAANRAANREAVAGQPVLDVVYLDLSAPTALEVELRRRVPAAGDALAWLLGAPAAGEATYGRPLNVALLHAAGRRLLFLDDDALLEPRRAPVAGAGFAVSSARDELHCYADRGALEAACLPLDVDPVAAHLECLGQSVAALWARHAAASGKPETLELDAGDAVRFAPDARALFTQNHALGDPGSSLFPYHLLSLPAASRAQLLRDPSWARHAFSARINWRGQPRLRLAPSRALTFTTLTGIDNRALIPPTVRAHRNEDLLLGQMTQHVHPAAWFVDLPWGLPHWRDPAKTWLDATASFAQEPVHFLMEHLESLARTIASEDPAARMQALGALLQDLGGAGDSLLRALLEEQAADTATRTLFAIEAQLDDPALPGAWKDALRPWLRSPALAIDPARLAARVAPLPLVKSLAMDYGRALAAWPELWNMARSLAA